MPRRASLQIASVLRGILAIHPVLKLSLTTKWDRFIPWVKYLLRLWLKYLAICPLFCITLQLHSMLQPMAGHQSARANPRPWALRAPRGPRWQNFKTAILLGYRLTALRSPSIKPTVISKRGPPAWDPRGPTASGPKVRKRNKALIGFQSFKRVSQV